jgi:hypothetical protein
MCPVPGHVFAPFARPLSRIRGHFRGPQPKANSWQSIQADAGLAVVAEKQIERPGAGFRLAFGHQVGHTDIRDGFGLGSTPGEFVGETEPGTAFANNLAR